MYFMKHREIIILNGEIQSGKSSALMLWCNAHNASGFITPTLEGRKELYDIRSKQCFPYQLSETAEGAISVGKYYLDANSFRRAEEIYEQSNQSSWFVMDEIGKLELAEKGHAKLFRHILSTWQNNILIVVRNSLLEEVTKHFQLSNFRVIHNKDLSDLM
jgi:nucleoside-triphosphatase THEP1